MECGLFILTVTQTRQAWLTGAFEKFTEIEEQLLKSLDKYSLLIGAYVFEETEFFVNETSQELLIKFKENETDIWKLPCLSTQRYGSDIYFKLSLENKDMAALIIEPSDEIASILLTESVKLEPVPWCFHTFITSSHKHKQSTKISSPTLKPEQEPSPPIPQQPLPLPQTKEPIRQCSYCSAKTTPLWRRGPYGPGTLCNACGVKWKNGKILSSFPFRAASQGLPLTPSVKRRAMSVEENVLIERTREMSFPRTRRSIAGLDEFKFDEEFQGRRFSFTEEGKRRKLDSEGVEATPVGTPSPDKPLNVVHERDRKPVVVVDCHSILFGDLKTEGKIQLFEDYFYFMFESMDVAVSFEATSNIEYVVEQSDAEEVQNMNALSFNFSVSTKGLAKDIKNQCAAEKESILVKLEFSTTVSMFHALKTFGGGKITV